MHIFACCAERRRRREKLEILTHYQLHVTRFRFSLANEKSAEKGANLKKRITHT